jgi:hypothetical protein
MRVFFSGTDGTLVKVGEETTLGGKVLGSAILKAAAPFAAALVVPAEPAMGERGGPTDASAMAVVASGAWFDVERNSEDTESRSPSSFRRRKSLLSL